MLANKSYMVEILIISDSSGTFGRLEDLGCFTDLITPVGPIALLHFFAF
jgi:hypothetical protein